ncbi:MAG: hypothetical protein WBN96_03035 [Gammaproteobacteria bacterium]
MNEEHPIQASSKTGPGKKITDDKKPPSDFLQGLVLFIAFIIFMAVWLYYNVPG